MQDMKSRFFKEKKTHAQPNNYN